MDGEHIEICLRRSIPPKLKEAAIIELGRMREELYVLRQFASALTPRAPDEGYCEHSWSYPPEFCNVCHKRVPLIRLRG